MIAKLFDALVTILLTVAVAPLVIVMALSMTLFLAVTRTFERIYQHGNGRK